MRKFVQSGPGRKSVLTLAQRKKAERVLAKTPRGRRRETKKALGKEFGCHWRTIENAVKGTRAATA